MRELFSFARISIFRSPVETILVPARNDFIFSFAGFALNACSVAMISSVWILVPSDQSHPSRISQVTFARSAISQVAISHSYFPSASLYFSNPRKRNESMRSVCLFCPYRRGFGTSGAVPTSPIFTLPPGTPTAFPPSYIYTPIK